MYTLFPDTWLVRSGGDGGQAMDLAARPYRAPLAERLAIRWNRLRRWEFWPAWLFYVPIVGYILWLGLRFRQPTAFTASNPAFESGGVVGESKAVALGALMERAKDLVASFDLLDRKSTRLNSSH